MEIQVLKSIENTLKFFYFLNNFFASVFNFRDNTNEARFRRYSYPWFKIRQSNVNNLLSEVKIMKSTDSDGIGNTMLKKVTDDFIKILTFVLQSSVKFK